MQGDFTLNPLDYVDGALYVLQQQGRVHLDSDFNQQVAALVDYVRLSINDILGGSAALGDSFSISDVTQQPFSFRIAAGTYYVDGYRCSWPVEKTTFLTQPAYDRVERPHSWPADIDLPVVVYLDVWLRHDTFHNLPLIREAALRGPDTATRGVLTWQVKAAHFDGFELSATSADEVRTAVLEAFPTFVKSLQPDKRGLLTASVSRSAGGTEPCLDDSPAGYTGPGNQLYRVEIYVGADPKIRFKWDRDNGSVVWRVASVADKSAIITPGPGPGPSIGDWAELVDDTSVLSGQPRKPVRIVHYDPYDAQITFEEPAGGDLDEDETRAQHAVIRRWNGCEKLAEGKAIPLEHGVQVTFAKGSTAAPHAYRNSDYWLIPARVDTGDVIWPGGNPQPPHGVEHHYAALALIHNISRVDSPLDCRRTFSGIAK